MKIKHYSKRYLPEIRKRLKLILELSYKKLRYNHDVASCKSIAEIAPHSAEFNLKHAQELEETIKTIKKEIQSHKDWIEKKSPGFWKRVSFVEPHIINWNLDLPAISLRKLKLDPLNRKSLTTLTVSQRELSLEKRFQIMHQWYCFFFGTDHLETGHSFF